MSGLIANNEIDIVAGSDVSDSVEGIVWASKNNISVIGINIDVNVSSPVSFFSRSGNLSAIAAIVQKDLKAASFKILYDIQNNIFTKGNVTMNTAGYGAISVMPCMGSSCIAFQNEVERVSTKMCGTSYVSTVQKYIEDIFVTIKSEISDIGVDYHTGDLIELMVKENNTFQISIPFGKRPPPLQKHSFTLDIQENNSFMYIFGGTNTTGLVNNDFWKLEYKHYKWTKILPLSSVLPPARQSHIAYMTNSNSLIIHGGTGIDGKVLCDTWEYNISSKEWRDVTPGSNLVCTARGSFTKTDESIYVFGGYDSKNYITNSLIMLNTKTFKSSYVETIGDKPPAVINSMLTVLNATTLVLYGGCNLKYVDENIYLLTMGSSTTAHKWTKVTNTLGMSPGALCRGTMVKLDDNRILITGGVNSAFKATQINVIWNSARNEWIWMDSKKLNFPLSSHSAFVFDQKLTPSTCLASTVELYSMCPQEKRLMLFIYGGLNSETLSDNLLVYRIGPESAGTKIKCDPGYYPITEGYNNAGSNI
ncbi:hypothetical protein HK099_004441 [Clydaea vesicula]|uniref:Uncharacterized protein n=1 Tax=Clydaea vesicula TaxID=447962 RepID=A0AAD5XVM9_9FUNG|nr:hypothetical protein HK099_004441 [Clydaea vesicula]